MGTFVGGGFVKLRRSLWEHTSTGKLSGNDTYVFISLVAFADKQTGVFDGCASVLSHWIGLSEPSVTKALARLEAKGYILRDFVQGKKSYYRILIDKYALTVGKFKFYRVSLRQTKQLTGIPDGALNQKSRKQLRQQILDAINRPVYERDPEMVGDEESEEAYERLGVVVSERVDYTRPQDLNTARPQETQEQNKQVSKQVSEQAAHASGVPGAASGS